MNYDDGLDADGYPIEPAPPLADDGFTPGRLNLGNLLGRLEFAARLSKTTESPIETMMGFALHQRFAEIENVEIIPQMPWRQYRIDWVLRQPGRLDIFIECDGQEFHSEPGDIARDQFRDAQAAAAGIVVMRFTGSAIYRDPARCADSVFWKAFA